MPNSVAVYSLQVERLVFSTVFHVIWHIWFLADRIYPHHVSTASENEMISGTSEVKIFLQFNLKTFSTQEEIRVIDVDNVITRKFGFNHVIHVSGHKTGDTT